MLSPGEADRYARHIVLKGVGGPGQNKLKNTKVLVVGAGGLGSPVIQYLAAAGVGAMRIVDGDRVSLSNLQRQVVHRTGDVGQSKADSAADFVKALNPHVAVTVLNRTITSPDDARALVQTHDLVVECTDNFASRKLLAQAAEENAVPMVSGAVVMFDGQITVFAPHLDPANPRFVDLYPASPDEADLPACETVGVLGATTGVIGTLMAMEAIKLITGTGDPLIGRLLLYDGRAAKFTEMKYRRRD